ncbi:MAG: hypothetical protein J6U54_10210 [Clostridiales bacterium]|nr:hypothetical protein [Clostridiales bacterium]
MMVFNAVLNVDLLALNKTNRFPTITTRGVASMAHINPMMYNGISGISSTMAKIQPMRLL